MFDLVVLDSGPLGLASNPTNSGEPAEIRDWSLALARRGVRVAVPEISDYEVRRELLRAGKVLGLSRLDRFEATLEYLPLSTPAMRQAAQFWAEARKAGRPTAGREALDGDVILAAQALTATLPGQSVVVATSNGGHVGRFVRAMAWHEIP